MDSKMARSLTIVIETDAIPEVNEDEQDEQEISTAIFHVAPSVSDQKTHIHKNTQAFRNAMGEFVPPPGCRLLTRLALPTPGPSDYTPKHEITYPRNPSYSLYDRYPPSKDTTVSPGPKYNIKIPSFCCEEKFTIKPRIPTCSAKRQLERRGSCFQRTPASYILYTSIDNKSALMVSRTPDGVHVGPKSEKAFMLDSTDRKSFPSPSKYYPKSVNKRVPYQMKARIKYPVGNKNPGPPHYNVPSMVPGGPEFTLKSRVAPPQKDNGVPAPTTYVLPSTLNKQRSIKMRKPTKHFSQRSRYFRTPGPAEYVPKQHSTTPSFSFSYRPLEGTQRATTPASSKYNIVLRKNIPGRTFLERPPLWSNYQKYAVEKQLDLPVAYGEMKQFGADNKLGFKIKSRVPEKYSDNIPPNYYNPNVDQIKKRVPMYSFGKAIEGKRNVAVTSGMYYPKMPTGVSFSILGRIKPLKKFSVAPNNYALPSKLTRKGLDCKAGVSFKGRPSPYLYTGFAPMRPQPGVAT